MFALPALRETWPGAKLVYLGKPWHTQFLPGRGVVDEVLALPRVAGITAEGQDAAEVEGFCATARTRRFDLALQLFGGGRFSNPFLRRLGARRSAGLRAADAAPLDIELPYVPLQNERLRLVEAVGLVGARTPELAPRLPVLDRDFAALEDALRLPAGPLAVLQPGATDPRRRWPAKRFAEVGDALAAAGASVVVHGSQAEISLVFEVLAHMRRDATPAAGRLSLDGLAGLLARAKLVVSNDTGPLHLAQALGTPTVGVYWLTNLLVSGPLESAHHRHALALETRCPECGAENLHSRCAHDPSFVSGVAVEQVLEPALELWRAFASAGTALAPTGR